MHSRPNLPRRGPAILHPEAGAGRHVMQKQSTQNVPILEAAWSEGADFPNLFSVVMTNTLRIYVICTIPLNCVSMHVRVWLTLTWHFAMTRPFRIPYGVLLVKTWSKWL